MQCPICQTENPPTAASCTKCSTPLPLNDQTLEGAVPSGTLSAGTTPRGTSAWSVAVTPPPGAPYPQGEELVGMLLAERYEILELLGQGGMGAVYKDEMFAFFTPMVSVFSRRVSLSLLVCAGVVSRRQ